MKKYVSIILCLVLMFTAVAYGIPDFTASAATQSELEDKIDELDDEIAANKEKLESLKDDQEQQKEYLDTLEAQIETVEQKAVSIQTQVETIDVEITKLNTEINQISREIKQTQKEISETQSNIESSKNLLSAKLRSAYMNGEESTLKILMGADSLASFLTRLEMMKRTSENDKKVIEDFRQDVINLKEAKTKLEEDKTVLDDKKTVQVEKKSELQVKQAEYQETMTSLESQYVEIEEYIAQLDQSSATYQEYIAELEAEREEADAEIDRIVSEYYATSVKPTTTLPASNADPTAADTDEDYSDSGSAGGSYASSDTWAWPLGNQSCYITSLYGYRDASISGWSFHGGLDISADSFTGKSIYATRSGTVITAVTSYTGYGIYVMIDHGDGFSSLYGHMSARYVDAGDYVEKGQVVGLGGSTGNVTGPHLHFEVRYNGEKLDPLNYVSAP